MCLTAVTVWTVMSDFEMHSGAGTPDGGARPRMDEDEVIARIERLAELQRPHDGYPPEWLVEAHFIGDMNALAALALARRH